MTDTPVYDSLRTDPLRHPERPVQRSAHDGNAVTAPLPEEVVDAITHWLHDHDADLVRLLAPYGLHPHDIVRPDYRRVVYLDKRRSPKTPTGGIE